MHQVAKLKMIFFLILAACGYKALREVERVAPDAGQLSRGVFIDVWKLDVTCFFVQMFNAALTYWRTTTARLDAPNPWETEGPMTWQVSQWHKKFLVLKNIDCAGGVDQPVEASGHAHGRQYSAPATPRTNSAAVDSQLWAVYHPSPWGPVATVSAPESGPQPGCEPPSYGEA